MALEKGLEHWHTSPSWIMSIATRQLERRLSLSLLNIVSNLNSYRYCFISNYSNKNGVMIIYGVPLTLIFSKAYF